MNFERDDIPTCVLDFKEDEGFVDFLNEDKIDLLGGPDEIKVERGDVLVGFDWLAIHEIDEGLDPLDDLIHFELDNEHITGFN